MSMSWEEIERQYVEAFTVMSLSWEEIERQYVEVFTALVEKIEAARGRPAVRLTEPVGRLDRKVTAVWFIDGRNHGIRVGREHGARQVHAWTHAGTTEVAEVEYRIQDGAPVSEAVLESAARMVGLLP